MLNSCFIIIDLLFLLQSTETTSIMQKLNQIQSLSQKLSPQQIQFIKLLQVPTAELDARIEEELEINPALEEGEKDEFTSLDGEKEREKDKEEDMMGEFDRDIIEDSRDFDDFDGANSTNEGSTTEDFEYENTRTDDYEVNMSEYADDDSSGYKMEGDGQNYDEEEKEMPLASAESLTEGLMTQLGYLNLDEKQYKIAEQLIGSIDEDGYIRRELQGIVNDLAFYQGIETDEIETEKILKKIQTFDPAGIAARNLQECLLLQLDRKNKKDFGVLYAIKILSLYFEEFTKKHYEKIERKLDIEEEDLKDAIEVIIRLNPKPGGTVSVGNKNHYIIPDFILKTVNNKNEVVLNSRNAPDLRISRSYSDMIDTYEKSDKKDKKMKQTITFVKQKLDAAKWFIDAIKQRQQTLLRTMNAILTYQKEFFRDGDESKLRPMILKDIALEIGMDISTVSRVANSKSIQTDFGIFPLKFFFSESISTDSGEDVSSKEVKYILKEIIENEDKRHPYSDDKLESMLNEKGYNIARRTVAKYREQLNIPVARLRKEL
jgi:RNA polymerase sigma-54 factor